MPTTAQQQYQDDLMRQAVENARLAASRRATSDAVKAQMYLADKGLEGSKYAADTGLKGTESTNRSRLEGIGMEQGGQTDRARIMTAPEMERIGLDRTRYSDERSDKTGSLDYQLEQRLAQQLFGGSGASPTGAVPAAPQGGAGSESGGRGTMGGTQPQAPGGGRQPLPGDPGFRAWYKSKYGPGAEPSGSGMYDPNSGAELGQRVALAKTIAENGFDESGSKYGTNTDDMYSVSDAAPTGLSIRGPSGAFIQIAKPGVSQVKDAMVQEAVQSASPAQPDASGKPSVAASGGDMRDKLLQAALQGALRKKFGEDPEDVRKRSRDDALFAAKVAAVQADPDLTPGEKVNAIDSINKGAAVPVSEQTFKPSKVKSDAQISQAVQPMVEDVVKLVRSNNWSFGDDDVKAWKSKIQGTIDNVAALGGSLETQKAAVRKLLAATENALQETKGAFFETAGADNLRADIEAIRRKYGL